MMSRIANWSKEDEKKWNYKARGYKGFLKIRKINSRFGKWQVVCKVIKPTDVGYSSSGRVVFIRESKEDTIDEAKEIGYRFMREANEKGF